MRRGHQLLAIEGLRTLLTTAVLVLHWQQTAGIVDFTLLPTWEEKWWSNVYGLTDQWPGEPLVLCFFLISGFVAKLPPSTSARGVVRFFASRALRLGPIYYASSLIYLVVVVAGGVCIPYLSFLNVFALQSWVPLTVSDQPCSDNPDWAFFMFNAPTWFVSSLFWSSAPILPLLGPPLLAICDTPLRALVAATIFGLACSNYHWSLLGANGAWGQQFPLGAPLLAQLAGLLTARLAALLPDGGVVRGWHGWRFCDALLTGVLLLVPAAATALDPVHSGLAIAMFYLRPLCICALLFAMRCDAHGAILSGLASPCLTSYAKASYATYCIQASLKHYAQERGFNLIQPQNLALFLAASWGAGFALEATVGAWCARASKRLLAGPVCACLREPPGAKPTGAAGYTPPPPGPVP